MPKCPFCSPGDIRPLVPKSRAISQLETRVQRVRLPSMMTRMSSSLIRLERLKPPGRP